ncbi:hypothetical protein NQ317_019611 [Molorchus minor]|uniref:MORN repeat-containing protein 5 n=1 Tax=Molorchus minor TaxID=1323400 RepID=A0ABQ9J6Z9_9CUCU|nr:hypothetical protein NQ317_019611 [Molorchus minor]
MKPHSKLHRSDTDCISINFTLIYTPKSIFSAHFSDPKTPKSSGRSKRRERKLTYDWHREIKLNSVLLPPLYRIKGDLATKRHPGYKQTFRDIKEFCTGSTYEGNYNALGFAGVGEYIYPHGVIYNGYFKDGQFHGKGTLTYPMGQQIDGIWKKGRLVSFTFRFADGLEYSSPWKYCQQPNRWYIY